MGVTSVLVTIQIRFQWNVNSIHRAICWVYISTLKKHKDNTTKINREINRGPETDYINVCTKFYEFILIQDRPFPCPL